MMEPLYLPRFFMMANAFSWLRKELEWERRDGAPRAEYWTNIFDRPYTYGRGRGERTYQSRPCHTVISTIAHYLRLQIGVRYEGCFLNLYEGGRDWLGWHADDDPGIDHSKPISIVTIGCGREINWKKQGDKGMEAINRQFLDPGSLFVMPAGMQQTHYHRIPKAHEETGSRISLTFRSLLP